MRAGDGRMELEDVVVKRHETRNSERFQQSEAARRKRYYVWNRDTISTRGYQIGQLRSFENFSHIYE